MTSNMQRAARRLRQTSAVLLLAAAAAISLITLNRDDPQEGRRDAPPQSVSMFYDLADEPELFLDFPLVEGKWPTCPEQYELVDLNEETGRFQCQRVQR